MNQLRRLIGKMMPIAFVVCAAAPAQAGRPWTLEDEVTVPKVSDLRLLHDASAGGFIVETPNLTTNRVEADLKQIDMSTGTTRELLHALSLKALSQIPGSQDWSVLADLGDGEQLYRVDQTGKVTSLLANSATVLMGDSDGALALAAMEAPRKVGVLSYSWSPDGQWLWYAIPKRVHQVDTPIFDEEVDDLQLRRRRVTRGLVEFHLRKVSGNDRIIALRPDSDMIARLYGGQVSWEAREIRFITQGHDEGPDHVLAWAQPLDGGSPRKLDEAPAHPYGASPLGPHGGVLAVSGDGADRHLREAISHGQLHDYGPADFAIETSRSSRAFLASDGKLSLLGVRSLIDGSHRLLMINREHSSALASEASLTRCDFSDTLSIGLCVEEGVALPPRLVSVKPKSGSLRLLSLLAPRHEEISPLRVTAKAWISHARIPTSGYIVWPRDYHAGTRYPAILVTHGTDGDDTFVNADLEWNYPVQYLAEQGYLVVVMNDPSPGLVPSLRPAFDQWSSGAGRLQPDTMRDRLWLREVACFEDAIRDLERDGIVDSARVGIAGYSRGSQMVDVTMTRSTMFRAGSSGDGGYLEPVSFGVNHTSYTGVFGGSPYGPALANYQALSPSLNAGNGRGAILQQMAGPSATALDFHRALRNAGRPAQITLYPGENDASDETHLFHIPSNRLLAMRENAAWFDFWLNGKKSAILPWQERYDDWARMDEASAAGQ